ncbi:MAG: hypothetical protein COA78_04450 [Blastopirellula sp.]|nr:MAG: hypothetical protein COA78_04450 [Blastopirellula sp.]
MWEGFYEQQVSSTRKLNSKTGELHQTIGVTQVPATVFDFRIAAEVTTVAGENLSMDCLR